MMEEHQRKFILKYRCYTNSIKLKEEPLSQAAILGELISIPLFLLTNYSCIILNVMPADDFKRAHALQPHLAYCFVTSFP